MKKKTLVYLLVFSLICSTGCGSGSGDRVLVSKYLYDSGVENPQRFDVVVFRFPADPIDDGVPTNYIKRLLGLAGETIAIFMGQLFVLPPNAIDYPDPKALGGEHSTKLDWWEPPYQHLNDSKAIEKFRNGVGKTGLEGTQFQIIRKPPSVMLAMRRIVYDNDHQAKDLEKAGFPPRWASEKGANSWSTDDSKKFSSDGSSENVEWLRYRHILRPSSWPTFGNEDKNPQLITDFLGYNSHISQGRPFPYFGSNWVGDLMLEFELEVVESNGQVYVELRQGVDHFQVRFDLSNGRCKLMRLSQSKDGKASETELDSAETSVKSPGRYRIRFSNFDHRLTLWINGSLVWGHGVDYSPPYQYDAKDQIWVNTGPLKSDLKPANIGSVGAAIKVAHIHLWRDTYYVRTPGGGGLLNDYDPHLQRGIVADDPRREHRSYEQIAATNEQFWRNPSEWNTYKEIGVTTLYVQPGHFLCLGDNSPESSDGRSWGLVPQRLMLGRALVVYYPFTRAGFIR